MKKTNDKIEQLKKIIDDSTMDHFTDILEFYFDRCSELEEKIEKIILKESDNPCEYCKHHVKCQGKNCDMYIEGRGCTDDTGRYIDWDWSCMDFDFGDCPLLEISPCNGCINNDNKNFEWNGNV